MNIAEASFSVSVKPVGGIAVPPPGSSNLHAFSNHRTSPSNYEGDTLVTSLRTNPGFSRGEHPANWRLEQTSTPECNDWLADKLRAQPSKEISRKTGQGQRAAEAVKMGRNGLTMAHLVNICRADPEFRAQFFKFCGGHLEGEPEMVAALSHAINEIMRSKA